MHCLENVIFPFRFKSIGGWTKFPALAVRDSIAIPTDVIFKTVESFHVSLYIGERQTIISQDYISFFFECELSVVFGDSKQKIEGRRFEQQH